MQHNTPGISLEQFIAAKPRELRLGQWFVTCYWKPRFGQKHRTPLETQLWNADGAVAKRVITQLMGAWQWTTLPEITND